MVFFINGMILHFRGIFRYSKVVTNDDIRILADEIEESGGSMIILLCKKSILISLLNNFHLVNTPGQPAPQPNVLKKALTPI